MAKTLNPEWNEQCDFPVTDIQHLLLDAICWDKDRFGKDYLGEFDLALEEIFGDGHFEQPPKWFPLKSKRSGKKGAKVSGEVLLQFTLYDTAYPGASDAEISAKFSALVKSVPEAAGGSKNPTPSMTPILAPTRPGNDPSPSISRRSTEDLDDEDEDDYEIYDDETPEDDDDDDGKPENAEKRKRRLRIKGLKRKKRDNPYEFLNGPGNSSVVGIIFLEIVKITDLPRESNFTRTGFDMDPFVVASLGRKTYRTKVVRHNLNPVFNEKMIFNVLSHEQTYSFAFTVIDRDRYSGNDFIATTSLPLQELLDKAPHADPETGLYAIPEPQEHVPDGSQQKSRFKRLALSRSSSQQSLSKSTRPGLAKNPSAVSQADPAIESIPTSVPTPGLLPTSDPMSAAGSETSSDQADPTFAQIQIPLKMKNQEKWETKHNPELFIRAKYVPYAALRQQFWRAMLKQYDTDESGRISKVELTTMLDTLGSTLRDSTIDSFFHRFPHTANNGDAGDLTIDEAVICLEDQLQKKTKASVTDRLKDKLPDFAKVGSLSVPGTKATAKDVAPSSETAPEQQVQDPTIIVPVNAGEEGENLDKDDLNDRGEEHVVEIRECPICHQPRLNKRTDTDIITHIATCASQDWRQVNNLMMAGFVTASQAQRKWYSKVITKISYGGYKLGANSANILVQDRITGQINEEKMSVYVRLGIRLLYKGLKSNNMETKRS